MLSREIVLGAMLTLALATSAYADENRTFWCNKLVNSAGASISTGIAFYASGAIAAGTPPMRGALLGNNGTLVSFTTPDYLWMLDLQSKKVMVTNTTDPMKTINEIPTAGIPKNSFVGVCSTMPNG